MHLFIEEQRPLHLFIEEIFMIDILFREEIFRIDILFREEIFRPYKNKQTFRIDISFHGSEKKYHKH